MNELLINILIMVCIIFMVCWIIQKWGAVIVTGIALILSVCLFAEFILWFGPIFYTGLKWVGNGLNVLPENVFNAFLHTNIDIPWFVSLIFLLVILPVMLTSMAGRD